MSKVRGSQRWTAFSPALANDRVPLALPVRRCFESHTGRVKPVVIRLSTDRSSATPLVCNTRTSAREDAMQPGSAESYFGECLSSRNIHSNHERAGTASGTPFRFSSTVPPTANDRITGWRQSSCHFQSACYRHSGGSFCFASFCSILPDP